MLDLSRIYISARFISFGYIEQQIENYARDREPEAVPLLFSFYCAYPLCISTMENTNNFSM